MNKVWMYISVIAVIGMFAQADARAEGLGQDLFGQPVAASNMALSSGWLDMFSVDHVEMSFSDESVNLDFSPKWYLGFDHEMGQRTNDSYYRAKANMFGTEGQGLALGLRAGYRF